MNETEQQNLISLTAKYKHICINIIEFTDILKSYGSATFADFEPITMREVLKTGLYGSLYGTNIWISKMNPPGCVRVSNENVIMAEEKKWSLPVPLSLANAENWDRIMKMKAFW